MKLCYISDARSIHLQRWVKHFAARGFEIHVISYHRAELTGATLHHIHHCHQRLAQPITYPYETLKIANILKRIAPDVVHLFYVSIDGLAPALFKRQPLCVSPLGSDIRYDLVVNPRFRPIIKYILQRADLILVLSQFLTKEISVHLKRPRPIELMPFGIDVDFFQPEPRAEPAEDDVIKIGYVKHLETHYGPEYLVQAMSFIVRKYPNTQLIMAGGGSQADQLESLVKELHLERNVSFPGQLNEVAVKKLLQTLDIFVMPTVCHESFGVSALEAAAMQLPVVATRKGGIPEVVQAGKTGILVAAEDSQQLAEAILTLIENPAQRQQMGKLGREFVTIHYPWAKWASRMEEIYLNLRRG